MSVGKLVGGVGAHFGSGSSPMRDYDSTWRGMGKRGGLEDNGSGHVGLRHGTATEEGRFVLALVYPLL